MDHLINEPLGRRVQVGVSMAKAVYQRAQEAGGEHMRHMLRPAPLKTGTTSQ